MFHQVFTIVELPLVSEDFQVCDTEVTIIFLVFSPDVLIQLSEGLEHNFVLKHRMMMMRLR